MIDQGTFIEEICSLAVAIQQIPAPSLQEGRRADFIHRQFIAEGLEEVYCDPTGNVLACLRGGAERSPVVVSAHLDTVFPEDTDLTIQRDGDRIAGPGIGDNSVGVAGLIALARSLKQRARLPGDVWLVANIAEEGLGDLKGMRAVVDRFDAQVQAYIVVEGMALGQVYYAGLPVRRYRVWVAVEGGHSWVDYGRPSAVHELAGLIRRLYALPLPENPRTTLNIGVISGGTSVNTIAANASMQVDLRSEHVDTLAWLVDRVESEVFASQRPGIDIGLEIVGDRPGGEIAPGHPLVSAALDCLREQGIKPYLNRGSTDANIPFSRGLPAVCIGLTTGSGAHTLGEYIHTKPLKQGIAQLVALVERAFQLG